MSRWWTVRKDPGPGQGAPLTDDVLATNAEDAAREALACWLSEGLVDALGDTRVEAEVRVAVPGEPAEDVFRLIARRSWRCEVRDPPKRVAT